MRGRRETSLLLLLAATLLAFSSPGALAKRASVGRRAIDFDRTSPSSPVDRALPPLARLATSYHGIAPTGEIVPRAGRGTFSEFVEDLKRAADAKQLSLRPIEFVFGEGSFILSCDGLFLEFGVFDGTTAALAADWRRRHCGPSAPPVYGFDTFEGLPETWDQGDGGDTWERGSFDLRGKLPSVPSNVRLVKGLFADTLPTFLAELRGLARHYQEEETVLVSAAEKEKQGKESGRKRRGGGGGRRGASDGDDNKNATASAPTSELESHVNPSGVGAAGSASPSSLRASYVHVDCDLYAGARDALSLLSPLIRPGTVLVFDDLVNYPSYREHEVKALWEWVASTGLHLRVIGVKGPLPEEEGEEARDEGKEGGGGGGDSRAAPPPPPREPRAVDLNPRRAAPHHHQSVAFVVV